MEATWSIYLNITEVPYVLTTEMGEPPFPCYLTSGTWMQLIQELSNGPCFVKDFLLGHRSGETSYSYGLAKCDKFIYCPVKNVCHLIYSNIINERYKAEKIQEVKIFILALKVETLSYLGGNAETTRHVVNFFPTSNTSLPPAVHDLYE